MGTLAVLPRPVVKVTSEQARVVVTWPSVPGAASYELKIVDPQRRQLEGALTRATSQAFDVVLFPGSYRAEVRAYPVDFTQPQLPAFPPQLNCSEGMAEFAVR